MARAKRKANDTDNALASQPKRNRTKKEAEKTASSSRPNRTLLAAANEPRSLRSSVSSVSSPVKVSSSPPAGKRSSRKAKGNGARKSKKGNQSEHDQQVRKRQANISVEVSPEGQTETIAATEEADNDGPAYWLMKAEPNSRIEKGRDVKFSIDDLQAATVPEAWDGVRNAAARNNMRAMMKGDQAFFYHSNCKVPGIAGTLNVSQEHSVDETAFDPEHPYYDEKSTRDNPKWCVVHVEFRSKFPKMVTLRELQKYAKDGGVLQTMQLLKQSRLSVSKVTKKEWEFIMSLVEQGTSSETEASQ